MKKLIMLVISLMLVFCLSLGLGYYVSTAYESEATTLNARKDVNKPTNQANQQEQIIESRLIATGDVICHPIVYGTSYHKVTEPYDFSHMYTRLNPLLEDADYATVTLETTLDQDKAFAGYPLFNTPKAIVPALADAGFDAFATATNHCLDSRLEGLMKTLDVIDQAGVARFGCRKTADEEMTIANVGGIKVALLNYADAYNGLDVLLSEEERFHISPLVLDQVIADIKKARQTADLVAVYPHWGVEYQTLPTNQERNMAHQMAKAGADLILGSHPHVIRPCEWIEHEGRKSFICYSMGNSISNQRKEFLGTIDTEIGLVLDISLAKTKTGAEVKEVAVLPSTVYINHQNGRKYYEACLIEDLVKSDDSNTAQQANQLKVRAESILKQTLPKL